MEAPAKTLSPKNSNFSHFTKDAEVPPALFFVDS